MSISLSSNFLLSAQLPLDARTVVADITARNAISPIQRFNGLTVYVVSTSATYQLQGGILDANWVLFSGSGGGVTSITGTANQVIASASVGAVTLSLPQSIATSSTPTFQGENLTDLVQWTVTGQEIDTAGDARYLYGRDTLDHMNANAPTGSAHYWSINGLPITTLTSTILNTSTILQFDTSGSITSTNYQIGITETTLKFNVPTSSNFIHSINGVTRQTVSDTTFSYTQAVGTGSIGTQFKYTSGAHTALSASSPQVFVDWNLTNGAEWSTGTLADQIYHYFRAPAIKFVGASTATDPSTISIQSPTASTNATVTRPHTLWLKDGDLRNDGGMTLHRTASGAGTATLVYSDLILGKNGITGGGNTVNLPAAATVAAGHVFIIKDETGTASTNPLTIDPNGAELIDGVATLSINIDYGSVFIYTDGTGWFTIGGAKFNSTSRIPLIASNNLSDVTSATTSRNNLVLGTSDVVRFAGLGLGVTASTSPFAITQVNVSSSVPHVALITGGTHSSITASSEAVWWHWKFGQTSTWSAGALSTQRYVAIDAPTIAFATPSTVTNTAAFAASAPIAGSNATLTRSVALWAQTGGIINDGATFGHVTSVGAGAYNVLVTDLAIWKTAITGGGDTMTLPPAANCTGMYLEVVDRNGNATSTNVITIDGNGSETISGQLTVSISAAFGVARLRCDGSVWILM